jgi:hypothetical protein
MEEISCWEYNFSLPCFKMEEEEKSHKFIERKAPFVESKAG